MIIKEYLVVVAQEGLGFNERKESYLFAKTSAKALKEAGKSLVIDSRARFLAIKVIPRGILEIF